VAIARTSLPGTGPRKLYHLRFPKRGSPRTANPDSPLSSFAYPLTQNFNAIITRTAAATAKFKEPTLPFPLEAIVPSTDQVVLLKISLYLRYGNIFFDVTRFHNNTEDHDDISLDNSNRISYLRFRQQRRAQHTASPWPAGHLVRPVDPDGLT
jgi:hypothetical protein